MVYGHTIKASAIETKSFEYPEKRVLEIFMNLKGSHIQHFSFMLRIALTILLQQIYILNLVQSQIRYNQR